MTNKPATTGCGAPKARWRHRLGRASTFVSSDIWDIELSSLSRMRRLGVHLLRVMHMIVRGFLEDECPLHASALTFNTIMAIVPILALSLALARGFGNADAAKDRIREAVTEWTGGFNAARPAVPDGAAAIAPDAAPAPLLTVDGEYDAAKLSREIEWLLDAAFARVEEMRFAALGTVGLILLLWMVVVVLGRVESSFNRVWGVKRGRPLWRKFTDYLSAVLILPFLMLLASSLPVADLVAEWIPGAAGDFIQGALVSRLLKSVTVLAMTTLTFTFVLVFMPNTRVRTGAGLTGGFFTAVLFLAWLTLCAALQVSVAKYGRLYGGFAVVPILLAWMHVSWQIVLLGAEVAFAVQNAATHRMELGAESASTETRLALALGILIEAARSLRSGPGVFDAAVFARERRVPVRLLNVVLGQLTGEGFLGELSETPGHYALLRDAASTSVGDVVLRLLRRGATAEQLGFRAGGAEVMAAMQRAAAAVAGDGTVAASTTLGELAGA